MPRTVWGTSADSPHKNDPSFLRGLAEEEHYETQRKAFHIPLAICPTTSSDDERVLVFRDYFNRNKSRSLKELDVDDCRLFCFKDCAIYGGQGLTGSDHFALLDAVYREWYPHRAEDQDVSYGNFFANFMRFNGAPVSVLETQRFHRVLCEKLRELVVKIPEELPAPPCAAAVKMPRPLVKFELRETFMDVFIVLNKGWQEKGVLLVYKDKDTASKHHCYKSEGITEYHDSDTDDLGSACVFQCTLKRAMQLVVSQDPYRARRHREYNEVLEETLGDEDVDGQEGGGSADQK